MLNSREYIENPLFSHLYHEEEANGNVYTVYVFKTPPMPIELSFNYNKIRQDSKFLFNFIEVGIGLEEIL